MRNIRTLFNRWRQLTKSLTSALRWGIFSLSILVIVGNVAAIVILATFENEAASFFSGGDPTHFYREIDIELFDDYRGVLGIAHNSGNMIGTTVEALAYDADIIEVDVVLVRGQLYAAHWSPFRFIGDRFFHGPTLEEVWGAAAQAPAIKLDLKRASNEMLDGLLVFLASRRKANPVIIVSDKPKILAQLPQAETEIIRLLSVSESRTLRKLLNNDDLAKDIDGVSIHHHLLTSDSVAALKEKDLLIFTWTVNDPERMNELVEYGVDAITTDNLAILQLLGTRQ